MRVFDEDRLEPVAVPVMLGSELDPSALTDAEFGPDASTILTRDWATKAIVWHLPQPGFPLSAPVASAPPMVAVYARFALASDARSHLMATGDNGVLKLWRVRWTPLDNHTAAPLVPDTLRFDGRHLVFVDGHRVGVFDITTGRAVGKTIALPEAPTYAGLDGNGTRLIAIAGREMSCWNWRDGTSCWPVVALPDSPLRLGLAAAAPMLAFATGSNDKGQFFEDVRLFDLATGRQRGAPVRLRGPLGALRLSADGRRLLVFEYRNTFAADSDLVRVIDTDTAKIVQNLLHKDKPRAHIVDARFAGDGSIWTLSAATGWGDGPDPKLWHWAASGEPIGKSSDVNEGEDFNLLTLPLGRGVIVTGATTLFDRAGAVKKTLSVVPDPRNRVNAGAISPDGHLLALALLDGVGLFVTDRNERLTPDLKLPMPYHDAVQQLAFAPDGSRLIGRTIAGHWFEWRIVADTRPVDQIEQDLRLRDFTDRSETDQGKPQSALSAEQRRKLRAADPGPAPVQPQAAAASVNNADVAPIADARYQPLNLDAIANVEPRAPMNRVARVPPRPQSLPTLPRGLQRYDGVDFLLGLAVQLSGSPRNLLNTEFPVRSPPLRIAPQRIAAIDALVFQFQSVAGETGAVRVRYADGGERVLAILDDRDTRSLLDTRPTGISGRHIGWIGDFATGLRGFGFADSGETAAVASYVVRMKNPEPDRPVAAISLEAPPTASPGLLFLALTLEPSRVDRAVVRASQ